MGRDSQEPMDTFKRTCEQIKLALLGNDTKSLGELYGDDFIGHNIYGGVENKQEILEAFQPNAVRLTQYKIHDDHFEIRGSVGIHRGKGSISGVFQGDTFEHQVRFVDLYANEGSGWKFVFSQATEIKDFS